MDYEVKRESAKTFLLNTLDKYRLADHLQGSWKADDFHLCIDDNISYSDVDILAEGIEEFERNKFIQTISLELSKYFDNPISVSIHNRNSLYKMSISDAQVLGIAEYIAQYRKIVAIVSYPKDYIDTKFTLLLLRHSFNERYQEVSCRIGTIEAQRALDVKLGKEKTFPLEYGKSLITKFGNTTAVQFLNHCLLNNPNDKTANSTLSQLAECVTIDQWLHSYLASKINQYSVS